MIKVHVFYEPLDGPWGGGNQFLKALKQSFIKKGIHAPLEEAQAVLVNSHHFSSSQNLEKLLNHLQKNPHTALIHRADGPVTLIRSQDEGTDKLIFSFNQKFADATVFQSQWCLDNCAKLGMDIGKPHRIIFNAPDPQLFYPQDGKDRGQKIKIIATSWSPSASKGFSTYQWMDRHLDWGKYSMTFVGNTPIDFHNINHIPPVPSKELGAILRDHDIYITASQNDPCSNSLIEALHCGLPALVLKDGGHPEITRDAGCCFEANEDIPSLLEKMSDNLDGYRKKIHMPDIDEISQTYLNFMENTYEGIRGRNSRNIQTDKRAYISRYRKKYEQPAFKSLINKLLAKIKK